MPFTTGVSPLCPQVRQPGDRSGPPSRRPNRCGYALSWLACGLLDTLRSTSAELPRDPAQHRHDGRASEGKATNDGDSNRLSTCAVPFSQTEIRPDSGQQCSQYDFGGRWRIFTAKGGQIFRICKMEGSECQVSVPFVVEAA